MTLPCLRRARLRRIRAWRRERDEVLREIMYLDYQAKRDKEFTHTYDIAKWEWESWLKQWKGRLAEVMMRRP